MEIYDVWLTYEMYILALTEIEKVMNRKIILKLTWIPTLIYLIL